MRVMLIATWSMGLACKVECLSLLGAALIKV